MRNSGLQTPDMNFALLEDVFKTEDKYRRFLSLRGKDAQDAFNACEEMLQRKDLTHFLRCNLIVGMQRLAKAAKLRPTRHDLRNIRMVGTAPYSRGGCSLVYLGKHHEDDVCIKMLVVGTADSGQSEKVLAHCARESILWARLSHANVHPFLGVCEIESRPCLISPLARSGNITDFLRTTPTFNNRLLLLNDIVAGLLYLHNNEVIHGDIKGANVLVDETGRAALADFGISSIFAPDILPITQFSSVGSKGGTVLWKAPELFDEESTSDEIPHNTKASDVYSLACTFYEVVTSRHPFFKVPEYRVTLMKLRGIAPERPSPDDPAFTHNGLSNEMWELMTQCWSPTPTERPHVEHIAGWLAGRVGHDWRPQKERQTSNPPPWGDKTNQPVQTVGKELKMLLRLIHGDKASKTPTSKRKTPTNPYPGFRGFMEPVTPDSPALRSQTPSNTSTQVDLSYRRPMYGTQFVHYNPSSPFTRSV